MLLRTVEGLGLHQTVEWLKFDARGGMRCVVCGQAGEAGVPQLKWNGPGWHEGDVFACSRSEECVSKLPWEPSAVRTQMNRLLGRSLGHLYASLTGVFGGQVRESDGVDLGAQTVEGFEKLCRVTEHFASAGLVDESEVERELAEELNVWEATQAQFALRWEPDPRDAVRSEMRSVMWKRWMETKNAIEVERDGIGGL